MYKIIDAKDLNNKELDASKSSLWNVFSSPDPKLMENAKAYEAKVKTYDEICMSIRKLLALPADIQKAEEKNEWFRNSSFEHLYSGNILKDKILIDKATFKQQGTAVRMSSTKTWEILLDHYTQSDKQEVENILRMYAWLHTVPGLARDMDILEGKFRPDSNDYQFPFDFLYRIGTVPKEFAEKVEEYRNEETDKMSMSMVQKNREYFGPYHTWRKPKLLHGQQERLTDFENYREDDYDYEVGRQKVLFLGLYHISEWGLVNESVNESVSNVQ